MSDPYLPSGPSGDQPPSSPPVNPYAPTPPTNPYGQQPPQPQYGAYQPPGGYPGGYPGTQRDPAKRPGTVTAAGIVTIIFSALSALVCLFGILAIVGARDEVLKAIRDEPAFDDYQATSLITGFVVALVVVLVWCLVSAVLGVLVMRRSNVARIVLVVSSAMTALTSLLLILSFVSAITLVAAGAVVVLLFTGGANAWFRKNDPIAPLPLGTQAY